MTAVPSSVAQLIWDTTSTLSWNHLWAASAVTEGAFYFSMKGTIDNGGDTLRQIRAFAIGHIRGIQRIFNGINFVIVSYGIAQLCDSSLKDHAISFLSNTQIPQCPAFVPIILGVGILTEMGLEIANRLRTPEVKFTITTADGIEVEARKNAMTPNQKWTRGWHIAKTVVLVANAFFIGNPYVTGLALLGNGYALLRNATIDWTILSKGYVKYINSFAISVTAHHRILHLEPTDSHANCQLCSEIDTPADTIFCPEHNVHRLCVARRSAEKVAVLHPDTIFRERDGSTTRYISRFDAKNLLSCPVDGCQKVPFSNGIELKIKDGPHTYTSEAEIIREQSGGYLSVFEKLYAVYNIAQAGLAYLQTYPELAASIFKIQEYMLATDLLGYVATLYYVCPLLEKKWIAWCESRTKPEQINPLTKWGKVAVIAAVVGTAALSYLVMLQLNAYMQPAIALKEVLKTLPIPTAVIDNIQVSWNAPDNHLWMQVLYVNRIASLAALNFFSKERTANTLSLLAQCGSLFGISRLTWMQFTQTFNQPLTEIVKSGGQLISGCDQTHIKHLSLTTHTIVDASHNVAGTLQSIYDYSTAFFNGSRWKKFLETTRHYRNGTYVGETYEWIWEVFLKETSLKPVSGTFLPSLTDWSVKVCDAFEEFNNVFRYKIA